MSAQPPERRDSGIADALQDVTDKVQVLVRDEIELAKAEVTTKVKKLGTGAAVAAAAGGFVLAAAFLVLHGIAWLLWYLLFPDEQFFWGFFLEAGILLLMAALAGFLAFRAIKAGSPPVPQMAIEEGQLIKETLTSERPTEVGK